MIEDQNGRDGAKAKFIESRVQIAQKKQRDEGDKRETRR